MSTDFSSLPGHPPFFTVEYVAAHLVLWHGLDLVLVGVATPPDVMVGLHERTHLEEERRCTRNVDEGGCPACGDPVDYCQGHGERGDPAGYRVLVAHDEDDHAGCIHVL